MKNITSFIYESSDKIANEKELFELIQADSRYQGSRGSHYCGNTKLYDIDLQYYNKKWIYNYSIYWRNNYEFPFIGWYGDGEGHYKYYIMNSKEDLKNFGDAAMKQDDSLFTEQVKKNTHKAKTSDYQTTEKELQLYVNSHKNVYKATVGRNDDEFYTWEY